MVNCTRIKNLHKLVDSFAPILAHTNFLHQYDNISIYYIILLSVFQIFCFNLKILKYYISLIFFFQIFSYTLANPCEPSNRIKPPLDVV